MLTFSIPFLHRADTDLIKRQNGQLFSYEVDKIHSKEFSDWFCERVSLGSINNIKFCINLKF